MSSEETTENATKEMTEGVDNLKVQEDPSPPAPQTDSKSKIDILLKATGNVPIMKKKRWTIDPDRSVGWVIDFVTKYLKLTSEERVFIYVNQTFAPAPDQLLGNLHACFSSDNMLVLHYCKTQAWG